jgi:hypothetical protein
MMNIATESRKCGRREWFLQGWVAAEMHQTHPQLLRNMAKYWTNTDICDILSDYLRTYFTHRYTARMRLFALNDLHENPEIISFGRAAKIVALERLLESEPGVVLMDAHESLEELASNETHPAFDLALGLGSSGKKVAEALQFRTGWFPHIVQVDIARQELAVGGYEMRYDIASLLDLINKAEIRSLAIVDDTIYSGQTMACIFGALPSVLRANVRIFALQSMVESLPALESFAPVSVGRRIDGRLGIDSSIIRASGLFERGSIRRKNKPVMAFYQRPEWIREWFPKNGNKIIAICHSLNAETVKIGVPGAKLAIY